MKTHDAIVAARQVRREHPQQRAGGHLLEVRVAQRRQIRRRRARSPASSACPLIAGALTAIECRAARRSFPAAITPSSSARSSTIHTARASRCSTSAAAIARCETDAADARHAAHGLPARAAAPQPAEGNAARHSRSHPRLSLRTSSATIATSPSICRPATTTATTFAIPCSTCTTARISSSRSARSSPASTGVSPKRRTRRSDRERRGR